MTLIVDHGDTVTIGADIKFVRQLPGDSVLKPKESSSWCPTTGFPMYTPGAIMEETKVIYPIDTVFRLDDGSLVQLVHLPEPKNHRQLEDNGCLFWGIDGLSVPCASTGRDGDMWLWGDRMGDAYDLFLMTLNVTSTTKKSSAPNRYPHTCSKCKGPCYIGFSAIEHPSGVTCI